MPSLPEKIKQAELLARSGEHNRARELFRLIVLEEPDSAPAWLWLSDLSTNLEEQTSALEKALALCPEDIAGNRDLQSRLNAIRGSIPLPAPTASAPVAIHLPANEQTEVEAADLLRRAERYIILGNLEDAEKLLNRIIGNDPQNVDANLLLSELLSDSAQKSLLPETAQKSNFRNLGQSQAVRPMVNFLLKILALMR